jgi:hypothetical protein
MQRQAQRWVLWSAAAALSVFMTAPAALSQSEASGATAQQPAQKTIQLVAAKASLDKTLDAKKAKQGDSVTAKLQQDVQIPGAQNLPKNTELTGHIDQVEASQHKSDSTIVLTFDHARLKDGQLLPIKATVMAIAQPVNMAQQQQQSGGGAAMPSAPAGAGGGAPMASSGGSPSGAGQAGGASAPPMNAPQSSMPSSDNQQQQQQPQQNGVPGVALKSDIHDTNSATFTSQGKNVHLDDGTQMAFAVAVIPAGVKVQ